MAFYNEAWLDARRRAWMAKIHSVTYRENGVTRAGVINSLTLEGDVIVMMVACPSAGVIGTLTNVTVYDRNKCVIGGENMNVARTSEMGVLLKIQLPIKEVI